MLLLRLLTYTEKYWWYYGNFLCYKLLIKHLALSCTSILAACLVLYYSYSTCSNALTYTDEVFCCPCYATSWCYSLFTKAFHTISNMRPHPFDNAKLQSNHSTSKFTYLGLLLNVAVVYLYYDVILLLWCNVYI